MKDALYNNINDWHSEGGHLMTGVNYKGPRLLGELLDKYGSYRKLAQKTGYSATYLCRLYNQKQDWSFKVYQRLVDLYEGNKQ